NDVLMLQPIFFNGKLGMFAAMRCHWNDVGGMTPGSLSGRVNEIIQEGIRIEPTKICDRGVVNEPFMNLLFNNMRARSERLGDYNAMVGTGRKAEEHLQRLFKRFGEGLLGGVEELIARSERQLRAKITERPDGDYFAEGYIESDGTNPDPLVVKLKLTVKGDEIIADFAGTSAQTNGPTNCGPAMALNAVGTIVKSFLDAKTPINQGSFNPITVISEPGTFINARNDAPCGGMAECKFLIDSVVASAMGKVAPEMTVGDLKGGANHIIISGSDPRGSNYIHYEWPAGGTGASDGTDGSNAVRSYNEGDFNSIQSVEMVEAQFPLRIERCEIRESACGDGEFRGGFGLRRDVKILGATGALSVLSEKNVIPPYGVEGGSNGAANSFTVIRDGEVTQPSPVPGKVSGFPLKTGDVVREETAGGGGYGDPLKRDAELVLADVSEGYLTIGEAAHRYGVILDGDSVDAAATEAKRAALSQVRISVAVELSNEEMTDGPRRQFLVPAALATSLDVAEGDLIEIVTGRGSPLRAWARLGTGGDNLVVSASSMDILGIAPGDQVGLRAARPHPETYA
ncbi:MAG: N-methylhydantoinase B, partial [Alphaproteobacteria bacterium]